VRSKQISRCGGSRDGTGKMSKERGFNKKAPFGGGPASWVFAQRETPRGKYRDSLYVIVRHCCDGGDPHSAAAGGSR